VRNMLLKFSRMGVALGGWCRGMKRVGNEWVVVSNVLKCFTR